ncbi:bacillithiol biosynthesis deacetylase BshB1 [Fuerstiella marisgermanici]|uniref:Bacillithiol biosynthesis deacetylase n=1 Tax=Fuerstiella marisgermanici TaxID=1891926 RepID=A0A1P8WSC3_9PLAN|nr:bacillithiol biosynthesis deacetylase BshB1 [Fuerstiella marisgermanici]APZ96955.1 bacillithiol biosynthesis deacetylase [Fuerstiella marisgermanici]
MEPLDLLVVAPHPDDAEISVGGIIAASRAQGMRVGVVELTSGEPTPHGTPELRRAETAEATRVLDLTWRQNLNLPNRSLQPTLEARGRLAEVFRATRPQIILAPYWQDAHPDHTAASSLCDDARFWSKLSRSDMQGDPFWPPMLLHYFSIHLRIHPAASIVLDVTPHIETKMAAVKAYNSQLIQGRSTEHPTVIDDIRDRARYWGWTIGKGYAEPLVNREQIGIESLSHLL